HIESRKGAAGNFLTGRKLSLPARLQCRTLANFPVDFQSLSGSDDSGRPRIPPRSTAGNHPLTAATINPTCPGENRAYPALNDILSSKKAAGRPRDLAVVGILERTLREANKVENRKRKSPQAGE